MSAESEFVFDAVIGFLTSPIWNFPVRTFIEENSLGMRRFFLHFVEFSSVFQCNQKWKIVENDRFPFLKLI